MVDIDTMDVSQDDTGGEFSKESSKRFFTEQNWQVLNHQTHPVGRIDKGHDIALDKTNTSIVANSFYKYYQKRLSEKQHTSRNYSSKEFQ